MPEAPTNALVLEARCPICDEWTVTCRFWSNKLPEYGWEGAGDESKSCGCVIDESNPSVLIDVCCGAYDSYVSSAE